MPVTLNKWLDAILFLTGQRPPDGISWKFISPRDQRLLALHLEPYQLSDQQAIQVLMRIGWNLVD